MNLHRMMVLQLMFAGVAGPLARAQTIVDTADSSSTGHSHSDADPRRLDVCASDGGDEAA
jgi:hypothetical protein